MIHINPTGIVLATISFVAVIFLLFLYDANSPKHKISELDKRLKQINDEDKKEKKTREKDQYDDLSIFEKLQYNLDDAEIQLGTSTFILIFTIASIFLYLIALSVFKQPLVAFAPLPFTVYLLPKMILDGKKRRVMKKFNEELIIVLRRMSSTLQTGSVLQALIEAKNIPTLSKKMGGMLNEIHHRYHYGDDIVDAFYKAAKGIKSEYLEIAIVSLDLNKELGADLGNSLGDIAMRIQDKQLSARESESLMASTFVIGQILSVTPFLIIGYLTYTNPNYFSDYLVTLNNQILFMIIIAFMFFGIYIVNTKTKIS